MAEAFLNLLRKAQLGDRVAEETLYKSAFQRLRGIASSLLWHERADHTLQPTALVSETFLKLHRLEMTVLDEDHFFRISARAMRQVLIDHGRKSRPVEKLGSDMIARLLAPNWNDRETTDTHLAVRAVFAELRKLDPMLASTVWSRSVEGLTIKELSVLQNRPEWRVRADHDFGLHWMARRLRPSG